MIPLVVPRGHPCPYDSLATDFGPANPTLAHVRVDFLAHDENFAERLCALPSSDAGVHRLAFL